MEKRTHWYESQYEALAYDILNARENFGHAAFPRNEIGVGMRMVSTLRAAQSIRAAKEQSERFSMDTISELLDGMESYMVGVLLNAR